MQVGDEFEKKVNRSQGMNTLQMGLIIILSMLDHP